MSKTNKLSVFLPSNMKLFCVGEYRTEALEAKERQKKLEVCASEAST